MRRLTGATLVVLFCIILGVLAHHFVPNQIIFSNTSWAKVTFFLVILLEVIIAPIPGGVIAFVGAAYFGFATAMPILYLANLLGAAIVFSLGRHFGRPFTEKMTNKESLKKYESVVQKYRSVLWIVYAIPVFPIDIITLVLSVSKLSAKRFFLMITSSLLVYATIVSIIGSFASFVIQWINNISIVVSLALIFGIAAILLRRDTSKKKSKTI